MSRSSTVSPSLNVGTVVPNPPNPLLGDSLTCTAVLARCCSQWLGAPGRFRPERRDPRLSPAFSIRRHRQSSALCRVETSRIAFWVVDRRYRPLKSYFLTRCPSGSSRRIARIAVGAVKRTLTLCCSITRQKVPASALTARSRVHEHYRHPCISSKQLLCSMKKPTS
jgi:hypothetical protein